MTLATLMNLGFAGGEAAEVWSKETLHVGFEKRTWKIYRGLYSDDNMSLYLDEDSTKKVVIDWAQWLQNDDSIASVTWETENNTNLITIANKSNTSTTATAYLTGTDYQAGPINVKCIMITDNAIPEKDSRSILVKTVRTY